MTDSRHSTPERGNKSVVFSLRNGCDPLISWLPHTVPEREARQAEDTVRAERRAVCTVVQLARSSKK